MRLQARSKPQANDSSLIRTKVNVEVSTLDPSVSVLGIPGFATRKTKAEMNVLWYVPRRLLFPAGCLCDPPVAYARGPAILLHASNDDGERMAAVLSYGVRS